MKTLIIVLFMLTAQTLKAQTAVNDSLKIVNTAKRDARFFRLNSNYARRYFTDHFPTSSDLFKPTAKYTRTDSLLRDSVYVKAFRLAASYNAVSDHQPPEFSRRLKPGRPPLAITLPGYNNETAQAARADARHFKLSKPLLIRFKADHFPNTSDYFKPAAGNASSAVLLTDSVYVQTYRFEAFRQAYHQRLDPLGHALIIIIPIVVGVTGVVAVTVAVITFYSRTTSIYKNLQ